VGRPLLVGTLGAELGDIIIEAAEACPVEVIKYELVGPMAPQMRLFEAAPVAAEAAAAVPQRLRLPQVRQKR